MTVTWPNIFVLAGLLLDRDESGSFRIVSVAKGWDGGPAVRAGLQSKAQQDGSWDGAGFSDGRVIDLTGFVEESSAQDAWAFLDALTALQPRASYGLTVVNASIGDRSVTVRVTVGTAVDWFSDRSFTYTLQVTAPDPVKYGPATFGSVSLASSTPGLGLVYPEVYPLSYGLAAGATAGAIVVGNAGTQTYWPRLRIDGPVTNPVVNLVESGAWVKYNGAIVAGQWIDFDLRLRRVLLQGQVSVRAAVSFYGDWLAVQPGGGSVVWTADTANPAALLSVWAYEGAYQ